MVGQQLQRYRSHQRFQALQHVGQLDDFVGNLGYGVVTLGDKGNHSALAGLDLLDIR